METYTILRRGDCLDWNSIPALVMDRQPLPRPHEITAQAQLCYDEEALYVRLQTKESDIRAQHTGLLDEICEDSCLEFFFCPQEGDPRYFNIEVNPNGAMFLGFGTGLANLQRLIPEHPPILPQITQTTDGWALEYAIPYGFVRLFFPDFAPAPGKSIRANCYKCGELTPIPHWLCWNEVPAEPFTFHCPDHFGIMYFA